MGLFSSATDKLFKAAGMGDAAAVAKYVAKGANVNGCNAYKRTPLTVAVFRPDAEALVLATVATLLARGADVNACDGNGNSALIFASWKGYDRVVEKLLAAGASLDLVNSEGKSALFWASSLGHVAIVQKLLDAGATASHAGPGGKTPLHLAASKGHSEIAQLLLTAGADPLAVSDNGHSSIVIAEHANHPRVAQLLRTSSSLSSSIHSCKSLSDSMLANVAPVVPLGAAPSAPDEELLEEPLHALVVEKADLDQELLTAADEGHLGGVIRSLARGANINARNASGATPLLLASRHAHGDVVQTLLMAKPDVDAVDQHGETAAMVAASGGHAQIVGILVAAGADIQKETPTGETTVTMAVKHDHVEVVRVLVGHSPGLLDPAARRSLLHCAAASGHADTTRVLTYLLEDCHLDPNTLDNAQGISAIQTAVALDHHAHVDCFLSHGARVDQQVYKAAISPAMQAALLSHNHALYNAQCVALLHASELPHIEDLAPLVPLITSVYDIRWLLTLVALCTVDASDRAALLHAACDHVLAMKLVFDTSACAYFKLMLESVDKSEWLPRLEVIELDRKAENINTESADWVLELKRKIQDNAWRLDAHEQCLRQVVDGVREVHDMVLENRLAVQTTMSQLEVVQSQVQTARQLHAQLARNTSQVVQQLHTRLEQCEDNVVQVAKSLQSFQEAAAERQHHEARTRKIKLLCSVVASIAGFVLAPVVKEIADAVVDLTNPLEIVQYVYGESDIARFLADQSSRRLPKQVQDQLAVFEITTGEFEMLLKEEIALKHPEYVRECQTSNWEIGDLDGGRADTALAVQPTLETQSTAVLEITAELRLALRVVEASDTGSQGKWRSPSMDMDDAMLRRASYTEKTTGNDTRSERDRDDDAREVAPGATNQRELVVFVDDPDGFPFHSAVQKCQGDRPAFQQAIDGLVDGDPNAPMRMRLCTVASGRESLCAAQYAYCLGFNAVGDLLASRMDPSPVFSTTATAMAVELVAETHDDVPYIDFIHKSQGDAARCEHYLALVDEDDHPLNATVEADVVRVVHSSSVTWSAAQYASHLGFVEVVKLLIQKHGKQLPVRDRMELLDHALAQRSVGRVAAHGG
jgi:ankyrin repeat protein